MKSCIVSGVPAETSAPRAVLHQGKYTKEMDPDRFKIVVSTKLIDGIFD